MVLSLATASLLSHHLEDFAKVHKELGRVDFDMLRDGDLKSEAIFKEDKKYHLDLKENARGRFLKISEKFQRGLTRFQVQITD